MLSHAIAQHLQQCPTFSIPYQSIATITASKGHGAAFQFCLDYGASLSNNNTTWALETASKDTVLMNLLYSLDWHNIKISQATLDDSARSAFFHNAAEVTWFLSHGAETGILNANFWDPSISAEAVRAFISYNPSNLSKLEGSGMLQKAAEYNNITLVKVLLEAGFDPNEQLEARQWDRGEDPTLALRHALYAGHEVVVRLLLQYGADPGLVGTGRSSAMELAKKFGNEKIVKMLEEHARTKSKI